MATHSANAPCIAAYCIANNPGTVHRIALHRKQSAHVHRIALHRSAAQCSAAQRIASQPSRSASARHEHQ
jgi:hypothetical protein